MKKSIDKIAKIHIEKCTIQNKNIEKKTLKKWTKWTGNKKKEWIWHQKI